MGGVLDTTKLSEVGHGCFSKYLNYCFYLYLGEDEEEDTRLLGLCGSR